MVRAPAFHVHDLRTNFDRTRNLDRELNIEYMKNSLQLDSPEMDQIRACARENTIAVSLGFSEYDQGSVYIAQVLVGTDSEVKAHRRKMEPTHMERTVYGDASGECFDSVVALPFARVGHLSCWEHIQPLLKYYTYSLRDCTTVISDAGIQKMTTANGLLVSTPGGGSSAVFGPDGRRLTPEVESTVETILYADLDMDQILASKMFVDALGHLESAGFDAVECVQGQKAEGDS